MYCRNFWDCFGSFFLFYIIKSGFFGVNGLPQVHRYGFYSVSAHFDPLRPPLGSLSDPRRHTLLSHGLCFKMHWKKTVHFSNSCQIAKYTSKFKKLDSFDIGKVRQVRIRQNSWGPMIFRWSKSEIRKKMDPIFCNFSKIAQETSKIADFVFVHNEFQKARILGY